MKHRAFVITLGLAASLGLGTASFAQTAPPPPPVPVATPDPGMSSAPAGMPGPGMSPAPAGTESAAPSIQLSPPPGTTVLPGQVPSDNGQGVRRLMSQQNNSGELGTVTLYGMGADKTRVVLNLKGAKPGTMQPAHIHRGRDCSKLDPKPAYPLTTVSTSESGGTSTTIVNAPISKLLSGNYSVNVHASTTNVARYVSCGNLYLH